MKFRLVAVAPLCALVCPHPALAQQAAETGIAAPVIVTATRVELKDTEAPYASEVHRREDIERSGASNLVDYLARHSSVQVLPNFGNRFAPSLNMRGYGLADGYQNVVVTVDGRRLNNVDMVPQLLGAVSLADVDRIEITKGSGSVLYGDGATAGTIQIHTRPRDGGSVELYGGSHGGRGGVLSAGLVRERFSISASAERSADDGAADKDASGHRDASQADLWRVSGSAKPVDELRLRLDAGEARIDSRYMGPLTLAQFKDDPAQNNGSLYTHQKFNTRDWAVGADYDLDARWRISVDHRDEARMSEFVQSSWVSDYRYLTDEFSLQYRGDQFSVTGGAQRFDGVRKGMSDDTSKRNTALFVQAQYVFEQLTLSAGARGERVRYQYRPDSGTRLDATERLASWDLGLNYRVDDALSVFGNYNSGYQAPDIDRFFSFDWWTGTTSFNGFIEPARARTLTVGLNHVTAANRLKLSLFHVRLKNEIFLEPFSYANTNIDRSHKYGLELQDSWEITPAVSGHVNYSWTRSIIDRDDAGGGAYDGKELPGVPRHSLVLGLAVDVVEGGSLYLSHTWRSKAWAADDFDNDNAQKQRAYQSTDLTYRHRFGKGVELYGAVNNLFEHKNGVWVGDDSIYPVSFERTWKLGARFSF